MCHLWHGWNFLLCLAELQLHLNILSGSVSNDAYSLTITLSSKTVAEITINSKNSVTLDIGDDSYTAKSGKITVTKSDANTIEGKFDCKFVKNSAGDEIAGTSTFSSLKVSI